MDALSSAISFSRPVCLSASSAMAAMRSCLRSSVFEVVISFSWSSPLHQSFFFTSSACCVFSDEIMPSIASFTFVKASSCTLVARFASSLLCACTATRRSSAVARERLEERRDREETCTKANVPVMASRASSSVRISIVSLTAWISSWRAAWRASKFSVALPQVSFRVLENLAAFASAFSVSPLSSFASARLLSVVAFSSSFVSAIFSPEAISDCFALRSSSKLPALSDSVVCASLRSAVISSCICFRTPTISPLWDS
mmetsp:Transcript_71653/g.154657  ORF Transcript_71653/g.154657 Transcript_71653/m.154657 type:complete len:258 (+) Transcript_71653:122-895(+)